MRSRSVVKSACSTAGILDYDGPELGDRCKGSIVRRIRPGVEEIGLILVIQRLSGASSASLSG